MKYFAKFYKPELKLNKSKHVKAKKIKLFRNSQRYFIIVTCLLGLIVLNIYFS